MPFYGQLPNCCGLSTFLMMINPEKYRGFKIFLNHLYEKIEFLNNQKINEYKWTIAINYLLLKSVGYNIIRDFIYKKDPELVDYYMPIIHFDIANEQFSIDNLVKASFFNRYLYTMKRDKDLKILFYLFGGIYHEQEQEISDSTRSLYYTKKDFKEKAFIKRKTKIMIDHLLNNTGDKKPSIALNVGYHWVAIQSIKENTLYIHNPLSRNLKTMTINKRIPERYRFYLFSYNENDSFISSQKLMNFLDGEVEMESQFFH
jgi:hypothetical protein